MTVLSIDFLRLRYHDFSTTLYNLSILTNIYNKRDDYDYRKTKIQRTLRRDKGENQYLNDGEAKDCTAQSEHLKGDSGVLEDYPQQTSTINRSDYHSRKQWRYGIRVKPRCQRHPQTL